MDANQWKQHSEEVEANLQTKEAEFQSKSDGMNQRLDELKVRGFMYYSAWQLKCALNQNCSGSARKGIMISAVGQKHSAWPDEHAYTGSMSENKLQMPRSPCLFGLEPSFWSLTALSGSSKDSTDHQAKMHVILLPVLCCLFRVS